VALIRTDVSEDRIASIFRVNECEQAQKIIIIIIAYCPLIRQEPHRKQWAQKFYCCMCIRCSGNVFTEPLPSNDRRDSHADWWEGFIKYTVEMNTGAMIYIPNFIQIASVIQRLIVGGVLYSYYSDRISPLLFFGRKENRLKMSCLCTVLQVDSKGFWRWCITLRITGLSDFVRHPVF
jgi:hypothetical protein